MQVTGEEGAALLAWQQLYSLLIVQEFGDTHMPQGYSCYVERLFVVQQTALCGLRWCPSMWQRFCNRAASCDHWSSS
jgi:hypothetical protein